MTRDRKRLQQHGLSLSVTGFVRIIRAKYAASPKGVAIGPSRFSSSTDAFRVLYAAEDFETALAEAVLRDRFVGRERRYIGRATLAERAVTLIATNTPLKMLDVRGGAAYALGIDTDAVRARDHTPGRMFSEWLHADTDFDGLLYDSRLTGQACIAVYERALRKIDASTPQLLLAHADLVPQLTRLGVVVRRS